MAVDTEHTKRVIDTAIRLGAVALVAYICFLVLRPFILPVAWGMIIAVAMYPLHLRLASALGGRSKLALTIFTVAGLALLIVPTVLLIGSVLDAFHATQAAYEAGTLHVPPPREGVQEWPIVGERLYEVWSAASQNLTATLDRYTEQIRGLARGILAAGAGAGVTILHFVISVLIAAVLMANAEACHETARSIGRRLAGDVGADFADLSTATTRSVAQGVLGVALIQALLAGVGMLAVGVPAAGVWALLVLVLAIVQLPPLVVLGPVMVYVFSANETVPAVIFMVWGLIVSASDTFLKPIFLGRGLDIPMLVILLGAIGGMLATGVIGLFVGAIVLALAYTLFTTWLEQLEPSQTGAEE
ncbi:MAG: AI-2E family transporter [Myxococcota bacterium]|nr:AI-2E family transporter [Myxococcota bacterium]